AGGAQTENLADVQQGLHYQLGVSANRPAGAKGIVGSEDSNSTGAVVVYEAGDSNSAAGAFIEGTDYTVDAQLGRVYIVPGGGIADGTDLTVEYTVRASTFTRVIS